MTGESAVIVAVEEQLEVGLSMSGVLVMFVNKEARSKI